MGNVGGCFSFSLVIVRRSLPRPSVNLVTKVVRILSVVKTYIRNREESGCAFERH